MDRRGLSGELAEAFARCDVPIIAAVNGAAVGAGFGLALCCDVRFLGASARMGSVFVKRGLAADYGAAWWLPRIVGHARAIELLYSGDLLDAERCLELGLASEVVPDGELLPRALEYAHAIAAGPPLAYTGVRRMLMRATELPMSHFLEYEWTTQLSLLGSEDASEGFRSFLERRDPHFRGALAASGPLAPWRGLRNSRSRAVRLPLPLRVRHPRVLRRQAASCSRSCRCAQAVASS